uniref:Conjugal transfer protein TraM n=1 Tax=Pseudomonas sp. GLE121 TaxID=1329969 RepID=R4LDC9_9PSED|nr:hypothetical protein [Pseudomonas sp. GLE121]AGL12887.1 conjugal transfer protein TraM [Pseudomonas sp. GLE121]
MKAHFRSIKNLSVEIFSMMILLFSNFALADGVDTGSTSLNSLKTWMMLWIPIACTVFLICAFLAIMFHMMRMEHLPRIAFCLIGIGSAALIVGFFGIS